MKPSNGNVPDVAKLRREMASFLKVKEVPKSVIARLVGASHGSVVNWERGLPPSPRYAPKLREVARELKAGTLSVVMPKRGPKPKNRRGAGVASAPSASAPRPLGRRRSIAISGDVQVAYANTVSVDTSSREARLRFGFALPGEPGARSVADVVVPLELLSQISG